MNSSYVSYINGNYKVLLNTQNGTKIRILNEGEETFIPEYPEGCDLLISRRCSHNCPFCYAGCSPDGKEPETIPHLDFPKYTEIAINLNDPFHKDIENFLQYEKDHDVIVNATVNEEDFLKQEDILSQWQEKGLLKGLGVSYTGKDSNLEHALRHNLNRIVHVIAGLFTKEDHEYLRQFTPKPKLLILGYKYKHRGRSYIADESHRRAYIYNMRWLKDNLHEILETYPVVSFDNKAINDVDLESVIGEAEYNTYYMGDEGEFTFTIDLVNNTYAESSQDYDTDFKPIANLTPTEMFQEIQTRHGNI